LQHAKVSALTTKPIIRAEEIVLKRNPKRHFIGEYEESALLAGQPVRRLVTAEHSSGPARRSPGLR
jgi:hypothetical protein